MTITLSDPSGAILTAITCVSQKAANRYISAISAALDDDAHVIIDVDTANTDPYSAYALAHGCSRTLPATRVEGSPQALAPATEFENH